MMTPLYEAHAPDVRKASRMLTLEVGTLNRQVAVGLRLTDEKHSHRMCLLDVEEVTRLSTALVAAIARANGSVER